MIILTNRREHGSTIIVVLLDMKSVSATLQSTPFHIQWDEEVSNETSWCVTNLII